MLISVAVPTCNRARDLEACLQSLSYVRYPDWELLIVDQSDGDQSERLVASRLSRLPKVKYWRLQEKNASAARNLAMNKALGKVIAFVNDDCIVPPDWLERVRQEFEQSPTARVVLGKVRAADHDASREFVPAYAVRRTRRLKGRFGLLRMVGIGANMAIRVDGAPLPRFDLYLGPGSRFRSSQDWDFSGRIMRDGEPVVETPRVVVTRRGARSFKDGAATLKIRDYTYGGGAMHMKLLRAGELHGPRDSRQAGNLDCRSPALACLPRRVDQGGRPADVPAWPARQL
jgi:glycosyltransferase involved in cell wall biosynthesis